MPATSLSLFDAHAGADAAHHPSQGAADSARGLGQYFTPFWAAKALIDRHFSDLKPGDVALEPTCGTGPFLKALPAHVEAIGVEIDPRLAEIARKTTGRHVITGDFTKIALDLRPMAIVGNPPFMMEEVDRILDRCRQLLPPDGRLGFILPAYAFMTPSRVVRYSRDWSLFSEMIPRTLFPGLQCPLVFSIFRPDQQTMLVGMALYQEAHDVEQMPKHLAEMLRRHPDSWKAVVAHALHSLGGRGRLEDIYRIVEPKRPSANPWWKAQIRKVLRESFAWVGEAEYALSA